jgi:hypothetical protein
MSIVNLRTQLFKDDNRVGVASFGYDDATGISAQILGRQREVFSLTRLSLRVNPGALDALPNGVNLDLSDAEGTLFYFVPEEGDGSLGAVHEIGEAFFPSWNFEMPDAIRGFVIDGFRWAVDAPPTGESIAGAEVSGTLGTTEPAPIELPTDSRLPNQSPPVNRLINGPMRFFEPIECGCQILFGDSMSRCQVACRLLSTQ